MRINAKIDVMGLVNQTYKAQKNLAFSVVQGINDTAKQIQAAQREELGKRFVLRTEKSKNYLTKQAAIIKPFASVKMGNLFAEVSLGGKKKGVLLQGYEKGDERKPAKGSLIAQPVAGGPARPSFSKPVQEAFTFKGMALRAVRSKGRDAKPGKDYKGKHGTFTIAGVGVFQRIGNEREAIKLVYAYAKHQTLPAKLHWMKTAQDVANKWLEENITQAFLRGAKKKSPAAAPRP